MHARFRLLAATSALLSIGACGGETTVEPPQCQVSNVAVLLAATEVDVGATTAASASVTQQNCGSLTPTWSSEPESVATVSAAGVVLGVTPGSATIRATVGGVSGTAAVTVRAVCSVAAVTVTPSTNTVPVNGTVALTATVAQQGCPGLAVTWESLQRDVATVSDNGLVLGVAPGTATIRATANGVSGTAQVTVQASPLGESWTANRLVVAGTGDVPLGNLRAVAVFGPNSAFTASDFGVYRHDGAAWAQIRGVSSGIEGLWGTGPTDLFATGGGGLIERYNGAVWTPMASGTTETLTDVWGAGPSAVFAVGTNGVIRRFDGTNWSAQSSGTTQSLWGVHGTGPTNVIAVGGGGTILHYDGSTWASMASPTTQTLLGVRVFSPTDAFAVGLGGIVLRFDGAVWNQLPSLNAFSLLGLWGASASDLYAVGAHGFAAHFDGATWTELDSKIATTLEAVGGSGTTAYAVGRSAVTMLTPTAATRLAYAPDLTAVWALDADNAVATTDAGLIWRYSNGAWQMFDTGTKHRFRDVWASGPGDIIAVGGQYPVSAGAAATRFDGSSWTTTLLPPGLGYMATVWGSGPGNVIAIGPTLAQWNGATWTPVAAGAFGTMEAAWGTSASDILAVGRNGTTLRYDGTTWAIGSLGVDERALGVWGSSPTNYYAVTDAGHVFRFDGASWSQVYSIGTSLHSVAGTGPNEMLAVGYSAEIVRYDGSTWSQVFGGFTQEVARAISGSGGRFFVVGDHGFVMITP